MENTSKTLLVKSRIFNIISDHVCAAIALFHNSKDFIQTDCLFFFFLTKQISDSHEEKAKTTF